jgi:small neutral amino acid transporter SnatA (MarC family)
MNNKLKAATFVVIYTLGIVLAVGTVQLILNYLDPTLEQLGVGFSVLLLAYAMKMMFDMRLGQLEARDRLNKITENNPTLK